MPSPRLKLWQKEQSSSVSDDGAEGGGVFPAFAGNRGKESSGVCRFRRSLLDLAARETSRSRTPHYVVDVARRRVDYRPVPVTESLCVVAPFLPASFANSTQGRGEGKIAGKALAKTGRHVPRTMAKDVHDRTKQKRNGQMEYKIPWLFDSIFIYILIGATEERRHG